MSHMRPALLLQLGAGSEMFSERLPMNSAANAAAASQRNNTPHVLQLTYTPAYIPVHSHQMCT